MGRWIRGPFQTHSVLCFGVGRWPEPECAKAPARKRIVKTITTRVSSMPWIYESQALKPECPFFLEISASLL